MIPWVCPRTILFAPADNPELVRKAISTAADAVCLDLEDGVAPQNKALARSQLGELIQLANELNKPVGVRVNSNLIDIGQDILAKPPGVNHVVVPKARGWSQLMMIAEALQSRFTIPDTCPRLIALVEDLASIQPMSNCATGINAIAALALGTEDLSADLGVTPNGELLALALYDLVKTTRCQRCVLHSPWADWNHQ